MSPTEKRNSKNGIYVLIVAFLIEIVAMGMLGNQQALLLEPVSTGLNISRTLYSSLDALTQTVNFLAALTIPFMVNKIGVANIVRVGMIAPIIYCFAMYAAGAIPNLPVGVMAVLIGVGQGSLGLCMSWCSTVTTVAILINNWFARNRGTVLGVVSASSSASGTIFATLIARWILVGGWEITMLYRGIIAVIAAVLVFIFVREKPGPGEMRIWESRADETELQKNESQSGVGLTFKEAIRTKQFYLMLVFVFLTGGGAYSTVNVLAAYATDLGYIEHSGAVISLVYFVALVIMIPLGALMEKFGTRKTMAPILVIQVIGLLILSRTSISLPGLYIAAFCLGCMYVMLFVPIPLMTREIFGEKELIKVQSYIYSGMCIGYITLYPVANMGYQVFGSYRQVYFIAAILYVLSIVVLFIFTQNKYRVFLKQNSHAAAGAKMNGTTEAAGKL